METEQQIEVGDVISDKYAMVRGPVIRDTYYQYETIGPIPCWMIINEHGLEQLIFKYDSKLVRKADG